MKASQERDEWLMAQVARGRRDCLEPLVRRYASCLLTFLQRMTGDRHRSEELFQEVFLAVWVKRRQYEFPRPFRSWLYAIAANKCYAAARSRRLASVALDDDVASPAATGSSPEDALVATETAALVSAAVAQLPPQQRAVVVLRVWEGMSYADIAEAVGRTEATVRSHMHHGLAALRKYLEPRLR